MKVKLVSENRQQFLKRIRDVEGELKAGGVTMAKKYTDLVFETVQKQYLVDPPPDAKKGAKRGFILYRPFAGANKADRKGKLKFVKGKLVNRSGGVKESFNPIKWGWQSGANSAGTKAEITKNDKGTVLTVEFNKRTSMILGVLRNAPHRFRIMELANGKVKRTIEKIIGIELGKVKV